MHEKRALTPKFVVCIDNAGYAGALELHKVYQVLPDDDAAKEGDLRVVDESGEDYLYSAARFIPISVASEAEESVLKAATARS
jgi:hypothetical protein